MNNSVFMILGTLVFVAVSAFAAPTNNLIDRHQIAAELTSRDCLTCHSAILKETTRRSNTKTLHRLHLESTYDTPKQCTDCHQSIDLREHSGAALRKQVDPQICAACHSGGMDEAKILFIE